MRAVNFFQYNLRIYLAYLSETCRTHEAVLFGQNVQDWHADFAERRSCVTSEYHLSPG